MKVICIDDKNRPDGIPSTRWIKKGNVYTVIEVAKLPMQGGMLGFKLEEINIDDCFPYQYFDSNRFIPLDTHRVIWTEVQLERLLEEAVEEEEKSYLNN